ncbi:aminoacyl-tRNA hydrolase [Sulfobacillus harzensis]|uniref:Peptidyl-tRNA hydrolase n=1 Tax=Sulfobacillus harzensis TaxID=2729629 RepID=A0A7Y0L1G1_9FIRM|nr:aminoacyl-tRNA hydrolase [Sulfobacillus harzensis]NMP21518.1 aminoacyl-tRNA hydrolase [Sulfobacillus harzensis]
MGKLLVVGLGNPGPRYERTRHNMGFMVADAYAESHGLAFKRSRFGLLAEASWGWILKPGTFMNLSGQAVGPFVQYYRLMPQNVLVIADDLDLPLGTLRIRRSGSSGGHNGLKSIIAAMGTEEFARMRLGISRPPAAIAVIDWVLMRFGESEVAVVEAVLGRAQEALDAIRSDGLDRAMSRFNG